MRSVISKSELELVQNAERARNDAIQVDAFGLEEYAVKEKAAQVSN